MNKVELLAPAGSVEAFKAAVINGADAIYIGARSFGARKTVGFEDEQVVELVKYAHIRGVKVYVTLNTLIYNDEIKDVMEVVDFLYNADIDAVLVQDLGLLYLIKNTYPDFEVHASTQLNTHTVEQAETLKKLGIYRVVLARETPKRVITQIKEQLGMEVEVFVHGALCMCYSGECLMSSFIGKRSGNRGECAQPCRLPYALKEENKLVTDKKYLLSMKDLNTIDYLNEIIEAGADSLKIEGRLKNPEYVAQVVKTYRKAIDAYYEERKFFLSDKDKNNLAQVFNRDFTKGYINGELPHNIVNIESSNNKGVLIGEVINIDKFKFHVKLNAPLSNGDGIRISGNTVEGFYVNKMYQKNQYIQYAEAGEIVSFEYKKGIKVHDKVYKTFDLQLNKQLQATYTNTDKKTPISAKVYAHKNEALRIEIEDGERNINFTSSYIVDKANNSPTTKEKISEQLYKLGNEPYYISSIDFDIEDDIIIPISFINELRRESIAMLNEQRAHRHIRKGKVELVNKPIKVYKTEPCLKIKTRTEQQKEIAKENGYKYIYTFNDEKGGNLSLPRINNRIMNDYKSNQILINELSDVNHHKYLIADAYMNVTNIYSAYVLYSLGCNCVTLSLEMSEDRIASFSSLFEEQFGVKPNLEVIVYGYNDLMVMKYCPINKGLGIDKQGCLKCKHSQYYLQDRKGYDMPLVNDSLCTMKVLNTRRISLLKYLQDLLNYGISSLRVELTVEDEAESNIVCKAFKETFENDAAPINLNNSTSGYYKD